MRIAVLVESFGRFGGREQVAAIHALCMRNNGHEVTLFFYGIDIPPYWRESLSQVNLDKLPTGLPRSLAAIKNVIAFLLSLRLFDRIISYQMEPLLAWLLSITFPRKLVVYITSPFEVEWVEQTFDYDYRSLSATFRSTTTRDYGLLGRLLDNRLFYLIAKKLALFLNTYTIHHCKRVIAVSELMAREAHHFYHLKERPCIVYAPLNPDLGKIAPKHQSMTGSYVLAVGALVPGKNFKLAIEAMHKARLDLPLVIAGKGDQRYYLEKLSRTLKVNTIFTYASSASELAKLYENALFVVQTSFYEALSLVTVEAGLFYKPVIIANARWNGATGEQVLNKISGITIEGNDDDELARAIKLLANNSELRRRFGLNGHKLSQRFLPASSTEKIELLIT